MYLVQYCTFTLFATPIHVNSPERQKFTKSYLIQYHDDTKNRGYPPRLQMWRNFARISPDFSEISGPRENSRILPNSRKHCRFSFSFETLSTRVCGVLRHDHVPLAHCFLSVAPCCRKFPFVGTSLCPG